MCASSLTRAALRWITVLACCASLGSAFGQQNSREQEQLRRLRQQLQQLQQGQASQQEAAQKAQAEKAATQGELESARTQLGAVQATLRRARTEATAQALAMDVAQKEAETQRQQNAALQSDRDRLQAELQASARSNEQLRTAGGDLQRRLALADAAQADLAGRHLLQARGLQTCIASNFALRDLGQELMQRYASKSVADVLAENEPFLALRRVRMENLMQDYQDKLDQNALQGTGPARTATPGGDLSGTGAVRGR
jgi:chromosome segregation ATPase